MLQNMSSKPNNTAHSKKSASGRTRENPARMAERTKSKSQRAEGKKPWLSDTAVPVPSKTRVTAKCGHLISYLDPHSNCMHCRAENGDFCNYAGIFCEECAKLPDWIIPLLRNPIAIRDKVSAPQAWNKYSPSKPSDSGVIWPVPSETKKVKPSRATSAKAISVPIVDLIQEQVAKKHPKITPRMVPTKRAKSLSPASLQPGAKKSKREDDATIGLPMTIHSGLTENANMDCMDNNTIPDTHVDIGTISVPIRRDVGNFSASFTDTNRNDASGACSVVEQDPTILDYGDHLDNRSLQTPYTTVHDQVVMNNCTLPPHMGSVSHTRHGSELRVKPSSCHTFHSARQLESWTSGHGTSQAVHSTHGYKQAAPLSSSSKPHSITPVMPNRQHQFTNYRYNGDEQSRLFDHQHNVDTSYSYHHQTPQPGYLPKSAPVMVSHLSNQPIAHQHAATQHHVPIRQGSPTTNRDYDSASTNFSDFINWQNAQPNNPIPDPTLNTSKESAYSDITQCSPEAAVQLSSNHNKKSLQEEIQRLDSILKSMNDEPIDSPILDEAHPIEDHGAVTYNSVKKTIAELTGCKLSTKHIKHDRCDIFNTQELREKPEDMVLLGATHTMKSMQQLVNSELRGVDIEKRKGTEWTEEELCKIPPASEHVKGKLFTRPNKSIISSLKSYELFDEPALESTSTGSDTDKDSKLLKILQAQQALTSNVYCTVEHATVAAINLLKTNIPKEERERVDSDMAPILNTLSKGFNALAYQICSTTANIKITRRDKMLNRYNTAVRNQLHTMPVDGGPVVIGLKSTAGKYAEEEPIRKQIEQTYRPQYKSYNKTTYQRTKPEPHRQGSTVAKPSTGIRGEQPKFARFPKTYDKRYTQNQGNKPNKTIKHRKVYSATNQRTNTTGWSKHTRRK